MNNIRKKIYSSNAHYTRAKRRQILDKNREGTEEGYTSPKPDKKSKRGKRNSTVVPLTSKSLFTEDSMSEEDFAGFIPNIAGGTADMTEFSSGSGQAFFNLNSVNVAQNPRDTSKKTPSQNEERGARGEDVRRPQLPNMQAMVTEITASVQRDTMKLIEQTQRESMQAMKKDLEASILGLFQSLNINNTQGQPNLSIPPPNVNNTHRNGASNSNWRPNPDYELRYRPTGNDQGNTLNGRNSVGSGSMSYQRNNPATNDRNYVVPNDKVNMENWGIKYDGSNMTFESFIFRVESMKQASGYSSKQVFDNFHKLLTGENLISWYWGYRQGNLSATYEDFKIALNQEWGSRETDIEIWRKMLARRQRPNESFDKFWEDMRAMIYRLKYNPDPSDVMGLIRGNVLPEIELSLVADKTASLPDFIKACRVADDVLKKSTTIYGSKPFGFRKNVNEIEFEQEAVVDELKRNHRMIPQNSSNPVENSQDAFKNCWNCNEEHRFRDCIYEIKGIFCFRCGRRGVIAPKCRCQENRQ